MHSRSLFQWTTNGRISTQYRRAEIFMSLMTSDNKVVVFNSQGIVCGIKAAVARIRICTVGLNDITISCMQFNCTRTSAMTRQKVQTETHTADCAEGTHARQRSCALYVTTYPVREITHDLRFTVCLSTKYFTCERHQTVHF